MISATVSLFLAPYLMKASCTCAASSRVGSRRSEEHTSELQSRSDLVCRLLLEKKKTHSPPPARPEARPRRQAPPSAASDVAPQVCVRQSLSAATPPHRRRRPRPTRAPPINKF